MQHFLLGGYPRTYRPVDRDFDGRDNPYLVLTTEGQMSREAMAAVRQRHDPRFAEDPDAR